jgi:hypothetical protein
MIDTRFGKFLGCASLSVLYGAGSPSIERAQVSVTDICQRKESRRAL